MKRKTTVLAAHIHFPTSNQVTCSGRRDARCFNVPNAFYILQNVKGVRSRVNFFWFFSRKNLAKVFRRAACGVAAVCSPDGKRPITFGVQSAYRHCDVAGPALDREIGGAMVFFRMGMWDWTIELA
jgi:hypothetical protein